MKTVTVSFDLELAKKIQNGEVEGKIVDKCKTEYEIVKWNAMGNYPLVGVFGWSISWYIDSYDYH